MKKVILYIVLLLSMFVTNGCVSVRYPDEYWGWGEPQRREWREQHRLRWNERYEERHEGREGREGHEEHERH